MLAPKWIGTVGLNPAVRGIYQALGYRVAVLSRHYMLNRSIVDYRLAKVPPEGRSDGNLASGAKFLELDGENFWTSTQGLGLDRNSPELPRKTRAFIHARYLQHPFYRYRAFLINYAGHGAIAASCECSHQRRMPRFEFVDYLGIARGIDRVGRGVPASILLQTGARNISTSIAAGLQPNSRQPGFSLLAAADAPGLILPRIFRTVSIGQQCRSDVCRYAGRMVRWWFARATRTRTAQTCSQVDPMAS